MINDINEIKRFYDLVINTDLNEDDIWFLSASARNKYLNQAEREKYKLGGTEMFGRKLFYPSNFERYLSTIRQIATGMKTRLTNSNLHYPPHCLVIYQNICPSSTKKAMCSLLKDFANLISNNNTKAYKSLHSKTMAEICKSKSSASKWLDIDFDVKDNDLAKKFADDIYNVGCRFIQIKTRGGYHFLVKKDSTNKLFTIVKKYDEMRRGEVIFNKNAMVPLPGTSQGGFPVRIVRVEE